MSFLFGSKSKTEVNIPDPTPEEREQVALFNAQMEAALIEGGFDLSRESVTTFDNPARIESLQSNIDSIQTQINEADLLLSDTSVLGQRRNLAQQRKQELLGQLETVQGDLSTEQENSTSGFKINLEKAEDPRVVALKKQGKLGEAEALSIRLEEQEFANLGTSDEINRLFLENSKKFLEGDLSITANQKAELDASMERVKGPVLAAIQSIEDEVSRTGVSVSDQLDLMSQQIKDTGLEFGEALIESENRVKETGVSLGEALDQTIQTSRDLAEAGLTKQTRELRLNLNAQAAALGRPGTDPSFLRELQERTQEAITNVELNLANQAAQGKLGIAERTGSALEAIQGLRAEDVLRRGESQLGIGQSRAALSETTGLRREDLQRTRAGLTESLLRGREQQRFNLAQGAPLQQAQLGQSVLGFQAGQQQQGIANLRAGAQLSLGELGQQRSLRATQKTTTQVKTPSLFENLSDIAGVASGFI